VPSQTSQTAIVTDSATGTTVTLSLQPTTVSGLSVSGSGGGLPTAGVDVFTIGIALLTAASSNGSVSVTCDGTTALTSITTTDFQNLTGKITVGGGTVVVSTTQNHSGETKVQHSLGYTNTLNANGLPNSNYTQLSCNERAYYSGIGEITEANQTTAVVNCFVPMILPSAINASIARIDIYVLSKCVVASNPPGSAFSAAVGDYFIQRLYTAWRNINGTVTLANGSVSTSPINSFSGVAIVDTEGVPAAAGPSVYRINLGCTAEASGSDVLVQVQSVPYTFSGFETYSFLGTTLVQIYTTVHYN
jgi:hypothetical protein